MLGHDPRVRLQSAIDYINSNYSDSSYCIISGDLVNHGTMDDYKALRSKLNKLEIPFLTMVGNHDDRSCLRCVLPLPDNCMEHFIQYSVSVGDCLIICLDTQKTGADEGEFCSERYTWLREVLENAKEKKVTIFMHHPPMELGLPMQDAIRMENGSAFLEFLSDFKCVSYLFIGHVHRLVSGTVNGIPFATMRSVLYQAQAPRPDWNWSTFKPAEEAPNLGVISSTDSAVCLQYLQFCQYESGIGS